MFIFICPHCNAKLEAQDDWAGQKTVCPTCAQHIDIRRDTPPFLPEDGSDTKRRFHWFGGGKKYIWGRLYIFCIWIVVGVVFCAGFVCILFHFIQYSSEKKLRREELWQNIPSLRQKQDEFVKNLQDTIDLLAEKKTIGSNQTSAEISGFKLPDSIRQKEIVFNDELDSIHAVEESLEASRESIETIKELELCLEKNLREQLRGLQSLIESQTRFAREAAPLGVVTGKAAAIKTGFSRNVHFYLSEKDQFGAIQTIRREVVEIAKLYPGNQKLKNDLDNFLLFLDFIEGNLLSRSFVLQLDQLHGNFAPQQSTVAKEKKTVPGEKEYGNILQQLSKLYLAWTEEADQGEWYIAAEAKNLQRSLLTHLSGIRQEEGIASRELYELLFDCLRILFYCTMLSFALLVISDVLRAHFDCAENILKK